MFREKRIGYVVMTRKMLILQAFRHFTYITAHSPTLPLLYLRHSSFSNSSVAPPMSQLILQPFFCFSYVTGFFTYVTWRAAHEMRFSKVCYFTETALGQRMVLQILFIWTTKLENIEKSKEHLNNVMILSMLGKVTIQAQLSSHYQESFGKRNDKVNKNSYVLNLIINCICFCGAIGFA